MKKFYVVSLIAIMVLFATACGDTNNNAVAMNSPTSTSNASVADSSVADEDSQGEEDAANLSEVVASQNETDNLQSEEIDAQNEESDSQDSVDNNEYQSGGNILVAYFSRVGNTAWENGVDAVTSASLNVEDGEYIGNAEYLAKMAADATGGDLFLIQTVQTYPSDYRETTDAAAVEQGDNARPELASHVENMDRYDTVVLVYPNWWGTLPMPLYSFLEEYDFSGKTILPLCTHEGSRMGSSESAIAGVCPDAILLDGLAVRGSSASSARDEVVEWINAAGIL